MPQEDTEGQDNGTGGFGDGSGTIIPSNRKKSKVGKVIVGVIVVVIIVGILGEYGVI